MNKRLGVLIFGLSSYALGMAAILYLIGFIGGFLTPTSLDGPLKGSLAMAVAIDLGLILLFALQHSLMARNWFKNWLVQWIPAAAERSSYVLFSAIAVGLLCWLWQPLGATVWNVQTPELRIALFSLLGLGWATVFSTTFLLNHFDLFGLRQVWLYFREKPYTPLKFRTPGPYALVRHPLYVGWLMAAWITPTMGIAHLMFSILLTVYIVAAIRWEERDLVVHLGEAYRDYQKRVPMLIPRLRREERPELSDSSLRQANV